MVTHVGTRCDSCGYRGELASFFRRERGGLLTRWLTVCRACEPHRPNDTERRWLRAILSSWGIWSALGLIMMVGGNLLGLTIVVLVQSAALSGVFVVIWHEAGHALAAKALGAHVTDVSIGRGPPLARIRIQCTEVVLRRYAMLGGATHFLWLGPVSRSRAALVVAAGPAASFAAAVLAFWAAAALGEASEILGAACAGFGLAHLGACVLNLLPKRASEGQLASDGRLLLDLAAAPPLEAAKDEVLMTEAINLLSLRRFAEAANVAEAAWNEAPGSPNAAGLLLHAVAEAEGPNAALDLYRSRRADFAVPQSAAGAAYLQVNIADVALRADPPDLETAQANVLPALAAAPEAPEMIGTEGLLRLRRGDRPAGEALLQRALRTTASAANRRQFAQLLAYAARDRGDLAEAEAYSEIARRS